MQKRERAGAKGEVEVEIGFYLGTQRKGWSGHLIRCCRNLSYLTLGLNGGVLAVSGEGSRALSSRGHPLELWNMIWTRLLSTV